MKNSTRHLIEYIRDSVIGDAQAVDGPFGPRRVIYSDYTASGRALGFIEDYIRNEVLPMYANTHSETSGTGLQTSRFREDARRIIAEAVGAGCDDVVLFAGSGATGAIVKLIDVLNWRLPAELDQRYELDERIVESQRPVVFIGPYEHHSNELPWRESIATVRTIDEDSNGHPDLEQLERELVAFADRELKVGSFSAASNVTGIRTNTRAVTALLHRHDALSFWDFAAAAPYVDINMNPEPLDGISTAIDAMFLSPHKFVGGPGTPGLLVAKRSIFKNTVPSVPGGGTVSYVSSKEHCYLPDIVHREEGGTPEIIGSVRAGLVFQLKRAVGADVITSLEEGFIRRAIERWIEHPKIRILGHPEADRLGIVSFLVNHGDLFLHHNFVVAVLNDLFGIQARGGCSCAGPYGHRLLDIDLTSSRAFEEEIVKGCEGIKPGWVRLNFNYFLSEQAFDYILEAVELVADHGWKLLPLYDFDPSSGLWWHREGVLKPEMHLDQISYGSGRMEYRSRHLQEPISALSGYLEEARELFANVKACSNVCCPQLSPEFQKLRWFPLPSEIDTKP